LYPNYHGVLYHYGHMGRSVFVLSGEIMLEVDFGSTWELIRFVVNTVASVWGYII
jgi:hypothetical protein